MSTQEVNPSAFLAGRDLTRFSTDSLTPLKIISKPWGREEHFLEENSPFMIKLLYIRAGEELSLQAHDIKIEYWVALNGNATLIIENKNGVLENIRMVHGAIYACNLGQKHRLAAIEEDAIIFEVSTPEKGVTYRLEDKYSRPHETEEQRRRERTKSNF